MDALTLATYDAHAASFAAAQRNKVPVALRQLLRAYFYPGAPTADIGCGSGRDTAWLVTSGFPTVGYEASAGMLAEARRNYPMLDLRPGALPELVNVANQSYKNVLCSAVIMHLPSPSLPAAIAELARIMAPAGRLLLTYRHSTAGEPREADGRLYSLISPSELARLCATAGLRGLHQAAEGDGGRPGVVWHILVAEANA